MDELTKMAQPRLLTWKLRDELKCTVDQAHEAMRLIMPLKYDGTDYDRLVKMHKALTEPVPAPTVDLRNPWATGKFIPKPRGF